MTDKVFIETLVLVETKRSPATVHRIVDATSKPFLGAETALCANERTKRVSLVLALDQNLHAAAA
jgi:predicted homoserine dehydrogenase-like protein